MIKYDLVYLDKEEGTVHSCTMLRIEKATTSRAREQSV